MQISVQFLLDLIQTMDQHPTGAALFVVALAICSVALVAYVWMRK
jgi:cbb3-type cytochrome oxidase subunit 3